MTFSSFSIRKMNAGVPEKGIAFGFGGSSGMNDCVFRTYVLSAFISKLGNLISASSSKARKSEMVVENLFPITKWFCDA